MSQRADQPGLVELWPLAVPAERTRHGRALAAARRAAPSDEPRARVARAIAATIGAGSTDGERLASRGQPVQAGDIMVLVRRRNAFVRSCSCAR